MRVNPLDKFIIGQRFAEEKAAAQRRLQQIRQSPGQPGSAQSILRAYSLLFSIIFRRLSGGLGSIEPKDRRFVRFIQINIAFPGVVILI